jgi:MFS superfamily sulfate permease-like transporter
MLLVTTVILKVMKLSWEKGGGNALESLMDSLGHLQLGAILITLISLTILISWDKFSFLKKMKLVPGALVAVIVGVVLNEIFYSFRQLTGYF